MERYEFVCPCHFGLEAVLKKEIQDLGYEILQVEDGKVTFAGDVTAFARANVFLRTTERVLWKVGSFHAETFEELFEGTKNLPWEDYIPKNGKFWVAKAARTFRPSVSTLPKEAPLSLQTIRRTSPHETNRFLLKFFLPYAKKHWHDKPPPHPPKR